MKRTQEVNGNAKGNTTTGDPQPTVDVLLEVERPSVEELAVYPRDERYRRLRANTEAHRNQLECWIELQHLTGEVMTMSSATGFNLLFVKCTPHAAQELARAPGVVDVLPAGDAINGLQQIY